MHVAARLPEVAANQDMRLSPLGALGQGLSLAQFRTGCLVLLELFIQLLKLQFFELLFGSDAGIVSHEEVRDLGVPLGTAAGGGNPHLLLAAIDVEPENIPADVPRLTDARFGARLQHSPLPLRLQFGNLVLGQQSLALGQAVRLSL